MTKFVDAVTISGTRIRDDGYLVADARVARSGIQLYAGWELGKPDMEMVRVYRPADEVFSKDSMASFSHRPITNNHPDEAVTADNWKEYAVGNTTDEVARDGEMLRVPLMVADAAAIKDIQEGKRELSAGYSAELVWGDGVSPNGEEYDATQKDIRANHVAIVNRGRAGHKARIGDTWADAAHNKQDKGFDKMTDILRKIMVDGLQVETTEAGEKAIQKLTAERDAMKNSLDDATKAVADVVAAKDAELAKKDAELDAMKEKQLDAVALDAKVAARADLISIAAKIAPKVETKGLSDADIRKAVVTACIGAETIADKSESYIDARFDVLVEDAKGSETVNRALGDLKVVNKNDKSQMDDAFGKSVQDLNAWRNKAS